MSKIFTTNTSSLKATIADIRNLNVKAVDAKKINLKGKNILDYIKESVPIIKHSQDTRETITENDLWGQWVESLEDGTVIIHDDEVVNPNASNNTSWHSFITKIEDNKAYVGDTLYGNIQNEKIKDGNHMFNYCENLTSFTSDLPNLTDGYMMFYHCSNLTSFSSDLPNLTAGGSMFWKCSQLTSFSFDLSSLMIGESMFTNCSQLTTFNSELSSLTNGSSMFNGCSNLTSFTSDLSSLTSGMGMFYDCTNLNSFTSDLPNLTEGSMMFYDCTNLTSFTSDLSSLTSGNNMFRQCKLDALSVMYIIQSIKDITAEKQLYIDGTIPYVTKSNDVYSATKGFMGDGSYVYTFNVPKPYTLTISASNVGKLTIGINVTNDTNTITDQLQDFAEGAYYDSWSDLKQAFDDKGWSVTWQYGGTTTSITYDIRDGERIIPCPVYTKLIEILPQEGEELTEEEKERAEYCSEDGTKFYEIEWGHDVTHPEEFQQFDSLETACTSYGVIHKSMIIEI